MNRRTFITNGVIAATALIVGGCSRYRRVNRPDPNEWIDRNREWDWLDDDDHFPDRGADRRNGEKPTKHA